VIPVRKRAGCRMVMAAGAAASGAVAKHLRRPGRPLRLVAVRARTVDGNLGRGQKRRLIQQSLATEPSLPESPRALVFLVGPASDPLIQAAHEPAQITQPRPPQGHGVVPARRRKLAPFLVAVAKQATVTLNDLLVRPRACALAFQANDEVEMRRKNPVGADSQGEDSAEIGQFLDDPGLAVVEGLAAEAILAAEEGAADAAADESLPYEAEGEVGW